MPLAVSEDLERARALYTQIAQGTFSLSPFQSIALHHGRGHVKELSGDYSGAKQAYEQALAVPSPDASTRSITNQRLHHVTDLMQ